MRSIMKHDIWEMRNQEEIKLKDEEDASDQNVEYSQIKPYNHDGIHRCASMEHRLNESDSSSGNDRDKLR